MRPAGHLVFNTISQTTGDGFVKTELGKLGLQKRVSAGVERTNTLLLASLT